LARSPFPERLVPAIEVDLRHGSLNLQVWFGGQAVWLTQTGLAELDQTSQQNINLHLQNLFDEQELQREAVVKEYLTTAADGKRYSILHYNLDNSTPSSLLGDSRLMR
jgi:hypothetical protein